VPGAGYGSGRECGVVGEGGCSGCAGEEAAGGGGWIGAEMCGRGIGAVSGGLERGLTVVYLNMALKDSLWQVSLG